MTRPAISPWPALCFLLGLGVLELAHAWPQRQHLHELQPLALAYGAAVLLAAGIGIGLVVGSIVRGLVLVAVTWACICAASIVKRAWLGSPLYPWDLLRVREVVALWPQLPIALAAAIVVAVLAVAVALAACVLSIVQAGRPRRARLREMIAGGAILVTAALPFHPALRALAPGPGNALSIALRLRNVRWWPEKNYHVNGFTAGFLISLDVLDIPPPPPGTWTLPGDCDPAVAPIATAPRPAPDVIVLLLESFFDPLTLGIPFSRDPIPFLRELMARSGHAELHSTFWAHGTANAEFEILTGLSTVFLPPDSVVFFHYLRAPVVSLATELRRAGYRAETVHPNAGWFYSRADAYPLLGFERSWFREHFLNRWQAEAQFSDDRFFFTKLRQRLTPVRADDTTPRFLWGVSLGTHGPYAPGRVSRCDLVIGADAAGTTAPSDLEPLRIYACLLERLDRHMREFVTWLEARQRPVVLFAYGDHLPPLGAQLDGHRHGVAGSASTDERPRGSSKNPLLMWSNTDAVLPYGYRGGFNFLAPAILGAAGIAPRCQFALLEPLHARIDFLDPARMPALRGTDSDLAAEIDRYWALTHRLLLEPSR
jgi:hypothetical protein